MTSDNPTGQRQIRPLSASDPRAVGPYTLVGRLGVGGMGVVYLAQGRDGIQVALKVVRSEIADQPHFRGRFAREVQAAKAVSGQYTARVIDADTDASPQWIATEYVPGPTLAEHVETDGPMREDQVRLLGLGLAEAIEAIHSAGLIHRDLKPSNIILSSEGPKVIDFGISQATDATSLTQTGVYVGSLAWMSPEQVTGEDLSPTTDMFSLGLLLAYAAVGRHPYGDGRPEAVAFRMVNQPAALNGLPPSLHQVCTQLLSKTPGDRPTPPAIVSALTDGATRIHDITRVIHTGWDFNVAEQVQTSSPAVGTMSAAVRPGRKRRRTLAVALGIGTMAATGVAAAVAVGAIPVITEGQSSDASAGALSPETVAAPTEAGGTEPTAPPQASAGAPTYAVLGASPLSVRTAPSLTSQSVGQVIPGDRVSVECTARGDAVAQDNGVDNRQWNYITSPFQGFVPDAFIDAGGVVAPQPTCEATDETNTSATYPTLGSGVLDVRVAPFLSADAVGFVPAGDSVQVVCTAQGDPVRQGNGIDNRQWNYITFPFEGFIPDAVVDAGGVTAPQPECSSIPERQSLAVARGSGLIPLDARFDLRSVRKATRTSVSRTSAHSRYNSWPPTASSCEVA